MMKALSPSQELLDTLKLARDSQDTTKGLVLKAYNLAIRDGFLPMQARDFLLAELPFLSESSIRRALPDEAKDQTKVRHSSSKVLPTSARNVSQNTPPKEDNVVNITTSHDVIDAPEKEEIQRAREVIPDLEPEPANPELEFLRDENRIQKNTIAELEDVVKQFKQMKPATELKEGFSKQDSEDWNSVTYRMGMKDLSRAEESLARNMTDLIKKDLPALRNRGWMSVEVTMRVL